MTRGRFRFRRVAKWAGVAVCVLLFVLWDLSTQFWLAVNFYGVYFQLNAGKFSATWWAHDFFGRHALRTGDATRPTTWVLGLIFPSIHAYQDGLRIILVPIWALFLAALTWTWAFSRGASGHGISRWRWLQSARQRVGLGVFALSLLIWWASVRSITRVPDWPPDESGFTLAHGAIIAKRRIPLPINTAMAKKGFPDYRVEAVRLPLWIPVSCIGLITLFMLWRDRRRIPPGHCRKCGYDLTLNTSGQCPECGMAIPKAGETGEADVAGQTK